MVADHEHLFLPKFEDRLWAELAQLHASRSATAAPRVADRATPRHRSRLVAAAAAVALAGAGVAVAAVVPGSDEPTDVATSSDRGGIVPAPPRSEGLLGGSQAPGQDGPPDAIVFVEQVNDDGTVYRSWTDEATGRTRRLGMDAAGNPDLEGGYLSVEPGADCDDDPVTLTPPRAAECTRIEERYVDHTQGTYRHNGYAMPGDRSTARVDDGNRRSLRTGSSVEDGLEVVDGRELLRLVDALGARGCATSANGTEVCVDIIPNVDAEWVCEGDAGWTTLSPTTTTPAGGEGPNARASADELSVTEPGALEPPDVDEDECVLAGDLELVDEPSPDPTLGVTWVDPESYRSVKRIGYPGSEAEYTMTFEYLERTSENLALLDVEIPDGYVEETD